jgi:beta-ureidopropionase / N-carbamoyl-L-amino-acid hydrolase
MMSAAAPRLDRLMTDWAALSAFTDITQPGWTRRAFTPPYLQARAWLTERMADAGLQAGIDAGGNLIGRVPGQLPAARPLVLGSHTDTVTGGGRFDGILGVLAAVEVARALREAGIGLRHPLEVIDFLGEEPNDFGLSMVGSRALAGTLDPAGLERRDLSGRTLADAIGSAGGDPDRLAGARRAPGSVACYLELHIEQGRRLERAGCPLGVVTAITGVTRYLVELHGRADHAGGTAMGERCDALAGAAQVISAMERLWLDGAGVGTVGRLTVSPNSTNVVPETVTMWTDMRSLDGALLDTRRETFAAQVSDMAGQRGLRAVVDLLSREEPVPADPDVCAVLTEVASRTGRPYLQLPSYAGHDANQMAKIAPIGMLFAPSRDGRSHCPGEWTEPEDVAVCLTALAAAVVRLDEELGP